jgi:hypothetical protein
VELIEVTATIAITNPINESIVFIKGKGNKTTLRKLPNTPNKNIPIEAPRIIVVKPIVGLNPKEPLEMSD